MFELTIIATVSETFPDSKSRRPPIEGRIETLVEVGRRVKLQFGEAALGAERI